MLNPSNLKIDFVESSTYVRFAVLIYGFSFLLLYLSGMVWFVKIVMVSVLFFQLIRIIKKKIPNPNYTSLSYASEIWTLQTKTSQSLFFEKVRIILDLDFCFLLELRTKQQKKLLVIFSDQLNREAYRLLRIIEKTQ